MAKDYIELDFTNEEKKAFLKYVSFFVMYTKTTEDLTNERKTWIRFTRYKLSDVIGELSFHFNRTKSDYQFNLLDELIAHLENYDQRA